MTKCIKNSVYDEVMMYLNEHCESETYTDEDFKNALVELDYNEDEIYVDEPTVKDCLNFLHDLFKDE